MTTHYKVTVERTIGDVSNKLIAHHVTADQAIDLLLHIQQLPDDDEVKATPEPAEKPAAPAPAPKKNSSPKKASKALSYDKEAVIADLENKLPVAEIAAKHKVTKQVVYNIRHKTHLVPEPSREGELQPAPTAYAQRQRERQAEKPSDMDIEDNIKGMVEEGLSISELEMMFPKVPLTKLTSLYREIRPND